MARKAKTPATTIATREDLENVFGEYAAQVIEMDRLTIDMEKRIAQIRAEYETAIAACKETGDALFDDLRAWASLHPAAFADRRSIELLHGAIGFRTCPPKVQQVPGVKTHHTLSVLRVIELGRHIVRNRDEVDKDAVLARVAEARRRGADALAQEEAALAVAGLRVVQDEVFFAEPRRENGCS